MIFTEQQLDLMHGVIWFDRVLFQNILNDKQLYEHNEQLLDI